MGQFDDVEGGASSSARETPQRTYTVRSGDSLSKIAEAMYGESSQWKRIYEANRDRIKNPDLIQPGWELTIP